MELHTESGLAVILERSAHDMVANLNGPDGVVAPGALGGEIMGLVPPVVPWQGWPAEWDTPRWGGLGLDVRVGTAMSCADLNSRQLSSFPIYRMRGLDVLPATSWMACPEPGLYSDWCDFAKQAFNSLQLRGECFLWATGRYAANGETPGAVARMVVVNPDRMEVVVEDGEIVYKLNRDALVRRDVLHIKHQSWPGYLRGIGPLEWTCANVMGAAALQAYMANLATRGGIPWAVLKSGRALSSDQATDLQSRWVSAAAARNGAPAILSGDLALDVLTISPKDMALLDLQVFNESRIAAAFGVPGFLLGLPSADNMTYSNVQQIFSYHWRATLRTMAQGFASPLSRWALPGDQRIEFNPDRYVEPEFAERANSYATMFNIVDPATGERAMTIAEIRAKERMSQSADPEATQELSTVGT